MANLDKMPAVDIYAITSENVACVANMLTDSAVMFIKNEEALGLAIAEDEEIRGAICVRFSDENPESLEIISIFVAPEFRRRGLGITLLLETVEGLLAETDGALMFATAVFGEKTEGVRELFEKVGFEITEEASMSCFQTNIGSLAESELLKGGKTIPPEQTIKCLDDLSEYEVKRFLGVLRESGIDYISYEGIRNTLGDASFILFDGESKAIASAIFTFDGEQSVWLSQFHTFGGANAAMAVLKSGAEALVKKIPGNTILEIPTVENSSASLVKKILPGCTESRILRAVLKV